MADFTKEELQYILYACERSSLEDMTIENKIRFMIDNYCEQCFKVREQSRLRVARFRARKKERSK